RFDQRDGRLARGAVGRKLAHGQQWRCAFDRGLLLDERDRANDRPGELVLAGPSKVGGKHMWHAASGTATLGDPDLEHLRVRQESVEGGTPGGRWVGERAVEGRRGGVPQGELGSRR